MNLKKIDLKKKMCMHIIIEIKGQDYTVDHNINSLLFSSRQRYFQFNMNTISAKSKLFQSNFFFY